MKQFKRTIRRSQNGLNLAIEINGVVAGSADESGSHVSASANSSTPISQGPGRPAREKRRRGRADGRPSN
jgi:hypothetical protein